ncbi:SDR family oxidoreductase [Pendulispora rubella]|uniref:SDR family oxidoreductase n=1 Tax=Pendulispora rubella TaxID=2741070 RepID=A0ABZ2KU97_9BACT
MTKKLEGKVALVTGGSRGLGVELARALADEGANVAISYVASEEKAAAVVREIERKGVRAAAFQADQGEPEAPQRLVDAVVQRFGKLDILVNNAAVSIPSRLDDINADIAALERQWQVNALGVVRTIRAAAKVLPKGGRIVTIGSGVWHRAAFPGIADYAGTKGAIVSYSKAAARDLAPREITVNVVDAGLMDTDMAAPYRDTAWPLILNNLLSIQRSGRLEEIAAAVVFLASPGASYITGAVVPADGGAGA